MEDDKKSLINEGMDIASEPTADTMRVESFEHTSEYEVLERNALKTLARRAMQKFQNGECISSELAMQHFKRFVV